MVNRVIWNLIPFAAVFIEHFYCADVLGIK